MGHNPCIRFERRQRSRHARRFPQPDDPVARGVVPETGELCITKEVLSLCPRDRDSKARTPEARTLEVMTNSIDNPAASTCAVWFLMGPLDTAETARHLPIHSVPFLIGRRSELSLTIPSPSISGQHAEISEMAGALVVRDLGSTNGTYVNGKRVSGPTKLRDDDFLQFANVVYRLRRQRSQGTPGTVHEEMCDRAMALIQFDKMMAERAVTPFFQPIVDLRTLEVVSYEALGRSRMFGLETPKDMFRVAAELNMEVELSVILRMEAIQASQGLANGNAHIFMNTHPREMTVPRLCESLCSLRESYPKQRMTLEIHESVIADGASMRRLKDRLVELDMKLAYDDFGAGQSRLNELTESPPDFVKFDMSLIRGIDSASPQRQQLLTSLARMVRDLGIQSIAEGIETQAEHEFCRDIALDMGQGFHYGRPAPVRPTNSPR